MIRSNYGAWYRENEYIQEQSDNDWVKVGQTTLKYKPIKIVFSSETDNNKIDTPAEQVTHPKHVTQPKHVTPPPEHVATSEPYAPRDTSPAPSSRSVTSTSSSCLDRKTAIPLIEAILTIL